MLSPAFYKIPDSALKENIIVYDFALLPCAVPCIAMNNGLYMIGINAWLLPAHTLPIRSVTYNPGDSSLMMLLENKRRSCLASYSLANGSNVFIDSLQGRFSRVFYFSKGVYILSGMEGKSYKLSVYKQASRKLEKLFESKSPITNVALFDARDFLIATAGMIIRFDQNLKIKQVYPIGYDIDGLTTTDKNDIIISTRNGMISLNGNTHAKLLLDKLHGITHSFNNKLYVLDADHSQIIKLSL